MLATYQNIGSVSLHKIIYVIWSVVCVCVFPIFLCSPHYFKKIIIWMYFFPCCCCDSTVTNSWHSHLTRLQMYLVQVLILLSRSESKFPPPLLLTF